MKKILIAFILFVSSLTYSQNQKFTLTKDGINKYVVVELDTINENVIFQKTINWVKEKFKKPDLVFDSTINNQMVRFTGENNIFRIYNAFGEFDNYPLEYSIKVSIKKGRYKFEILNLDVKHNRIDYSNIHKVIYKRNGKLISWYRDTPVMIEDFLNNLNQSLSDYIKGTSNDNNW